MKEEEELFELLLETPVEKRRALLDQLCAGQEDQRRRLERLLVAHSQTNLLDSPIATSEMQRVVDDVRFDDAPKDQTVEYRKDHEGRCYGPYTLERLLGEGGMGAVWVAKQSQPVKRRVALKLIKSGMYSREVLARFEHERQALAVMDHPSIARVLDGGLTEDGRPYFAMELVNGLPLTKFCDEAKLSTEERLDIFVQICSAVQHAHQKGLIHRDLKPANILVTLIDGRAIPKVIDFGVSKALSGSLSDQTLTTQCGAVIGTLEYMAPEQAGYSGADVDTRADIYALGVILYELLTGLRPFDSQRLRSAAIDEMLRIIREEEPSKPSTRLSSSESRPSLAAARGLDPSRLAKKIRGDLDWIALKCLEKDRNRRYETANQLALEIKRYLADEPVAAGPPSAGYLLKKFLRRNRRQVAVVAMLFMALLVGLLASLWQMNRAIIAEHAATEARDDEAQQHQLAEENARRAREGNRQTREALDAVTDDVVRSLFAKATKLTDSERHFFQRLLGMYDQLSEFEGGDVEALKRQMGGYSKVTDLQMRLGAWEDATRAYQKMERVWEEISRNELQEKSSFLNVALMQRSLASSLRELGKKEEAEHQFKRAETSLRQAELKFPGDVDLREWAITLSLDRNRMFPSAEPESDELRGREALREAEILAREFPDRSSIALLSIELMVFFVDRLSAKNQIAEALDINAKAISAVERLRAKAPEVQKDRVTHRQTHLYKCRGSLLAAKGDDVAAIDAFDRGIIAAQERVELGAERHFAFGVVWEQLYQLRAGRAEACQRLKRWKEAATSYWEAMDAIESWAPLVNDPKALVLSRDGLHMALLGVLENGGGTREEMVDAYKAAAEFRQANLNQFEDQKAYRESIASLHQRAAAVLMQMSIVYKSAAELRKAIDIREGLLKEFPDDPGAITSRITMGWNYIELADCNFGLSNEKAGMAACDRATELLSPIIEAANEKPEDAGRLTEAKFALAHVHHKIADYYLFGGKYEQAHAQYTKLRELAESKYASNPADFNLCHSKGWAYRNRANCSFKLGRFQEGQRDIESGIAAFNGIDRRYRPRVFFIETSCNLLDNEAARELAQGRIETALDAFRLVQKWRLELLADFPHQASKRLDVVRSGCHVCAALLDLGRLDDAVKEVSKIAALATEAEWLGALDLKRVAQEADVCESLAKRLSHAGGEDGARELGLAVTALRVKLEKPVSEPKSP